MGEGSAVDPGRQTGGHEKDECPPAQRSPAGGVRRTRGRPRATPRGWRWSSTPVEREGKGGKERSDPARAVHRRRAEGDAVDVARARPPAGAGKLLPTAGVCKARGIAPRSPWNGRRQARQGAQGKGFSPRSTAQAVRRQGAPSPAQPASGRRRQARQGAQSSAKREA